MDIYDVAKMLADTVDTIEKHYAQFVPAARDAVQSRMDTGVVSRSVRSWLKLGVRRSPCFQLETGREIG